ncbi:hypothetical protein DF032_01240 [Burkholderia seminalis]|nr:hypothetical protein DF032_01240 [Burkholderia seminalis]
MFAQRASRAACGMRHAACGVRRAACGVRGATRFAASRRVERGRGATMVGRLSAARGRNAPVPARVPAAARPRARPAIAPCRRAFQFRNVRAS